MWLIARVLGLSELLNFDEGEIKLMTMSAIEERVKKRIVAQLDVKSEEVTDDASFVDDLGADSLDMVELVMELEEEFDIEIPDDEAEKITTVQQAIDYIKAHVDKDKEKEKV